MREDKIRYPATHEMEKCFPNFQWELEYLQPTTVFLLGRQVSDFVFKKHGVEMPRLSDNFRYEVIQIGQINFIPIHHPSYILVYKRKFVGEYTQGLQKIILESEKKDFQKKKPAGKQPVHTTCKKLAA